VQFVDHSASRLATRATARRGHTATNPPPPPHSVGESPAPSCPLSLDATHPSGLPRRAGSPEPLCIVLTGHHRHTTSERRRDPPPSRHTVLILLHPCHLARWLRLVLMPPAMKTLSTSTHRVPVIVHAIPTALRALRPSRVNHACALVVPSWTSMCMCGRLSWATCAAIAVGPQSQPLAGPSRPRRRAIGPHTRIWPSTRF
jgi:hypothetical protein